MPLAQEGITNISYGSSGLHWIVKKKWIKCLARVWIKIVEQKNSAWKTDSTVSTAIAGVIFRLNKIEQKRRKILFCFFENFPFCRQWLSSSVMQCVFGLRVFIFVFVFVCMAGNGCQAQLCNVYRSVCIYQSKNVGPTRAHVCLWFCAFVYSFTSVFCYVMRILRVLISQRLWRYAYVDKQLQDHIFEIVKCQRWEISWQFCFFGLPCQSVCLCICVFLIFFVFLIIRILLCQLFDNQNFIMVLICQQK